MNQSRIIQQMTRKKQQSPKDKLASQMKRDALKSFRHSIALLKKSGIINKKVDARSLKPTPHYKKIIREFADVITGKVKAVKAPKYCPTDGCKTVKANRRTILLVDVSDKKQPRVRITKQGVSVIDRAFGKSRMDVVVSKKAIAILDLDDDQIGKLESDHTLKNDQYFIFTIENKKNGKSYMAKMSFKSLDKLISYMSAYQGGSDEQDFNDAIVTIRIMGDEDISNYQQKQKNETIANRRARKNAYASARRLALKAKSTRNII